MVITKDVETYYSLYPGYYATGDGARRDSDGYYWITGREDDVLMCRVIGWGPQKLKALWCHKDVAEAAVVGYEHEIKGQGIYCYVTLMTGVEAVEELKADLIQPLKRLVQLQSLTSYNGHLDFLKQDQERSEKNT